MIINLSSKCNSLYVFVDVALWYEYLWAVYREFYTNTSENHTIMQEQEKK
jgi:hypothetical protein